MIGLGIGIGIIFPSTVVLLNIPLSNLFYFLIPSVTVPSGSCGVLGLFCAFLPIPLLTDGFSVIGTIYPALNVFIGTSIYFIFQFLLLVLDLVIVYAIGDNIAKALGGTFRLSLGDKLAMV